METDDVQDDIDAAAIHQQEMIEHQRITNERTRASNEKVRGHRRDCDCVDCWTAAQYANDYRKDKKLRNM